MQLDWPILSVLIWLPIVGGAVMLALGDRGAALGRWVALLTTAVTFGISTLLWVYFDSSTALMQFTEQLNWIPSLHSYYSLGVDGIAMPLILLTTFITPLVVIASWTVIEKKPAQYYAAFLILEGLMIGVFAAGCCSTCCGKRC
jgi:NADH-quinone oxidoreductase subunit M